MKRLVYFVGTLTIFVMMGVLPENDTMILNFLVLFTIMSYFRFKDAGINTYWLFTILIPGAIFVLWLIGLFSKTNAASENTIAHDIVENKIDEIADDIQEENMISLRDKASKWHKVIHKNSQTAN